MMVERVCIVGAGAAGLAAIHRVTESSKLSGTVFEETGDIGGLWIYREKLKHGNYGPMYRHMRTNLPKQAMGFPDFEFPGAFSTNQTENQISTFMHHSEVLEYLNSYTEKFQLRKHIKFHRRVVDVRPIFSAPIIEGANPPHPKWRVLVQNLEKSEVPVNIEEYEFDSILVCNGHFQKPQMPEILNLALFHGDILHSIDYDDERPFVGKRVLVIGCGPSGVDIFLEIAKVALQVIVSNVKKPLEFPLPSNVSLVPRIKEGIHDGFICENGESVNCDAAIFCTGYLKDFPFLSIECAVSVEGGHRVYPLYHDMVHVTYPKMCFIGLPLHVTPFLLFDSQVQFCVKLFEGILKLPPVAQMLDIIECERGRKKSIGYPLSWSHDLGDRQWKYNETLAQEGNFCLPKTFSLIREFYIKVNGRRSEKGNLYKNDQIYFLEDGSYKFVEAIL